MSDKRRSHSIDYRGNTQDRSRRKDWLMSPEAGFGGDGRRVPCFWCGDVLGRGRTQADRIEARGRYIHSNIVPSCGSCNTRRSHRELEPHSIAVHPISGVVFVEGKMGS